MNSTFTTTVAILRRLEPPEGYNQRKVEQEDRLDRERKADQEHMLDHKPGQEDMLGQGKLEQESKPVDNQRQIVTLQLPG